MSTKPNALEHHTMRLNTGRRTLRFEPLEDRRLLALTVNTLLDVNNAVDGLTTLREAIVAAPVGETINFSVTGTINLSSLGQLTINKDLTIDGPGANLLTINAYDPTPAINNGDGSRIFNVDDINPVYQSNVSIDGLTISGGDVNGHGGAVRNLENLTLSSSSVTGNVASFAGGGLGGGLYNGNTYAILMLDGVTVSNNQSGFGGGIHNQSGSLTVANSTISGNVVTGNGGGIQSNFGVLNVANSTISDNNGAGAGGGILSYFNAFTDVTATAIRGNTANLGGGIWSRESTFTLNGSTISGNSAASNGGGIYHLNGTLTVNTTTIDRNAAGNSGGGIFSMGGTATVQNSMVSENVATLNAGGIEKRNGTLNVTNSTVFRNRSNQYGGGIWSYSSAATITGSTLVGNIAGSDGAATAGSGGGILQTYGSLNLRSSTITGNGSTGSGGGIFTYHGTLTVAHSTIVQNVTNFENFDPFTFGVGGGIHVVGSSVVLDHTIVAGNFRSPVNGSPEDDINGPVAARFSLIGSNLDATITNNGGNQIGTNAAPINPLLGPLADKGGQRTHSLLPGSPALDAGDPAAVAGAGTVPLNDQRGSPFDRIVDGNGIPGARIDIGAVEQQTVPGLNLVVDTLLDEIDGDYSAGDLSLREAIGLANGSGNVGLETITFDPALTSGGPAKILLIRGELQINESVTIAGPGAELLTIDASGNDLTPSLKNGDGSRVLNVSDFNYGTYINDVQINNLTITGADFGGGLYTAENLSLYATTITGNGGGGIRQIRGILAVTDSTISGNSGGGGITGISGTVVIERSTITGNSSTAQGGGVSNYYGNLIVSNSTISGNSAEDGGGIFSATNLLGTQTTTIINSTISGNTASGDDDGSEGGGIYNENGLTIIRHSTITNNSAPAGYGSGILAKGNSLTRTEVYSTIIAGNTNSDVDFLEGAVNSFQSNGYNLIGNGNAVAGFNQLGDQTGVLNPMLEALADNGGLIRTHLLAPGSPAIDAGDSNATAGMGGIPEFDQRGAPFTRTVGQIDIGALEMESVIIVVDTLDDESDGDFSAGDLSLREAIELANVAVTPVTIQFAPSIHGGTIVLSQGALLPTRSVFIDGPGAALLTIDASGNDPTPELDIGDGSRAFTITDGDSLTSRNVWINGLTITGADLTGSGGAIRNLENLTLTELTVANNHATLLGAGILSGPGFLNVIASTISGNSAAIGGGIWCYTDIAGKPTTEITNSTISGNTATIRGGGVYTRYGLTTIRHSTITNNTAPAGRGSGVATYGGALARTEVHSTIIAGNTNSDVDFTNGPTNTFQSNDYNLVGTGNALGVFNKPGDHTGVIDPLIGPLANNGGPTLTHALLVGSPAIDTGDGSAVAGVADIPLSDQRSAPFTRVFDGDSVPGARIDIGAVERQPTPPAVFGDYNNDGVVDAADYVMWRKMFGAVGLPAYSGADGNGNTMIDNHDHAVWAEHFGETPSLAGGSGAATLIATAPTDELVGEVVPAPLEIAPAPSESKVNTTKWTFLPVVDDRATPHDSASRLHQRITRVQITESVGDLLLLLANDRARHSSRPSSSVVDDHASNDEPDEDADRQRLEDEPLAMVLAEWR